MKEEQIIKLLEKAKTAISRLLFSYNRHWIKMSLDKCSGTSPSEIAGSIVNAEETAEAIKIALLEADKPETEPCTMCEGSRKIEENPESIKGYTMITCPRCKGTGIEPEEIDGLESYVCDKVFPIVAVNKQSDIIPLYTKAYWFRDEMGERAPGTLARSSGWAV
ncbi:hypothetical protein LCGC14_1538300, partial [marine sediment metagenome]